MLTLTAFPDIHDKPAQLKQIRHVLADVDMVLLAGDMTNGNIENLTTVLDMIATYNEQIYAICGNTDTEQMNRYMARHYISIHRKHVIVDGVAILGCGGALPFYGNYVFSEAQLADFLQDSLKGVPDDMPKILLCHQPPYGTAFDRLDTGEHVGSHAIRQFIETVQPMLCFTGHMHDCIGIDTLGETQIINPGPIWASGRYAYAEFDQAGVHCLELRAVAPLNLQADSR